MAEINRYRYFPALWSLWKNVLKVQSFRRQFIATILFGMVFYFFQVRYMHYIEMRSGFVWNDFVLKFLSPRDVSDYIFFFTYAGILITISSVALFPKKFLRGLQAFYVLYVFRSLCLYFVPLEPSPVMVPLRDPFLYDLIFSGKIITKDLFFSGHTSILFLFFLCVPTRQLKGILLIISFIVGFLLMLQHVHYSIDVFVAPIFAYISYRIVEKLHAAKFSWEYHWDW